MRKGNPNPNHPANQDSPSLSPPSSQRRKGETHGERGRSHPGKRGCTSSGEHNEEDLDALISAQLARDALQSSSSSVGDVPSSRAPPPLSDKEFGARKSRRDELIEGYRRVKRSRTGSRSHRDPELEALPPPPGSPCLRSHLATLRLTIFAARFAPLRHECELSGMI
jgi:hypothetical protein